MSKKKKGRDIHGVLLINKPTGASSNRVLQRLKWLLKANKAGHTGALDPLATGVLPICFGEATKFSQLLLDSDKAYQTTAKLGVITDSADADGETVETREIGQYSVEQVQAILDQHFTGLIKQAAPIYSALKVNGVPMYELARKGIEVEAKVREATIYQAKVLAVREDEIDLEYHVSKGTYIRSLVADLGQMLGCGAHVSKLHRIAHGPWSIEQCHDWAPYDFDEENVDIAAMEAQLLAVDSGIQSLPRIDIDDEQAIRMRHGNPVRLAQEQPACELIRIYHQEQIMGIGEIRKSGLLQPTRILNL